MPCSNCKTLETTLQKLRDLEEEVTRLNDENESLWFMLRELREADEALMDALSEIALEGMTPKAEA
jgi:hypothetical protein